MPQNIQVDILDTTNSVIGGITASPAHGEFDQSTTAVYEYSTWATPGDKFIFVPRDSRYVIIVVVVMNLSPLSLLLLFSFYSPIHLLWVFPCMLKVEILIILSKSQLDAFMLCLCLAFVKDSMCSFSVLTLSNTSHSHV